MAEKTAPVVLIDDRDQLWLEGAIKDKLIRHIEIDDINELQMGVASGGFGMIHAGKWRGLRVAVKVLYNPADFIQEVGIHRLVQDSDNIVKFYGITRMKSSGDYGMVLQFAGKGSLRDYLSRHFESLNWSNKIKLARDVASGIHFIHEDNICHHDLHSRNVLVDHTGRALITDFGLSRYVDHATSNNGVRGVVPYISPERLRNSPFDKSSDVYSLGVIMWELSSGHPPFDRDGENFLLPFQIMRGRREDVVSGTPTAYSNLYQRCWDGEPYNRARSPEILSALTSLLSQLNGTQGEDSSYMTEKWTGQQQATPTGPAWVRGGAGAGAGGLTSPSTRYPRRLSHGAQDGSRISPRMETSAVLQEMGSEHGGWGGNNNLNQGYRQNGSQPLYPPYQSSNMSTSNPNVHVVDGCSYGMNQGGVSSYMHPTPATSSRNNSGTIVNGKGSNSNSNNSCSSSSSSSSSNSNSNSNWIPRDGRSRIKDFFMACRSGNLEAVKWHLARNANVMEPYGGMSGRTPLHAAAMSDSYEVMRLLCEAAGPQLNLNELDDSSQTPLHLLTQFGRNTQDAQMMLVYMLKKGANPNAQDSERRTPLMTAVILGDNAVVVETLLDYGADPNIRYQDNNALADAAIRLRFQCVKVLLETDLSMSEQSSLEHAMDACYRVAESVDRNRVLGLLVRWKNAEGLYKRQTLATMILKGTLQLGEKRIDQRRIARQVLASAGL
ncbi:hypothetical protein BGX31_004541 [Mortierella sp. GBA43]|nr:hypothetical protein BGX31_004541 [Mortierella sp. GBA43]